MNSREIDHTLLNYKFIHYHVRPGWWIEKVSTVHLYAGMAMELMAQEAVQP